MNCTGFQCELSELCIPDAWRCDGMADCGQDDQSDEKNCCN